MYVLSPTIYRYGYGYGCGCGKRKARDQILWLKLRYVKIVLTSNYYGSQ